MIGPEQVGVNNPLLLVRECRVLIASYRPLPGHAELVDASVLARQECR
jgi:hypothetical protein